MPSVSIPAAAAAPATSASTVYTPLGQAVYSKAAWDETWQLDAYLVADEYEHVLAPSHDRARLTFHYGKIHRADKTGFDFERPLAYRNRLIQIRHVLDGVETRTWTGHVIDPEDRPHHGIDDAGTPRPSGEETIYAVGLSDMLDQVCLYQGRAEINSAVVVLGRMPDFNGSAAHGTQPQGNRSDSHGADGCYVFSADGDVWTNLDIINYLLTYHCPTGIAISLTGATAPLDRIVEIHRLEGQTLWQALRHLIPHQRGLVFSVEVEEDTSTGNDTVSIVVDTTVEADLVVGDMTLPGNSRPVGLDLTDERRVEELMLKYRTNSKYERFVVLGAPVRVAFTMSTAGGAYVACEKAWADAEETAYDAAEDEVRGEDRFQRVYRAFRLPRTWNGKTASGGVVTVGVDDNGNVTPAAVAAPWLHGKELERMLPIQAAAAVANAEPEFLPPFAAAEVTEYDGTKRWIQLDAGHKELEIPAMGLRMMDRELGVMITGGGMPHMTGLTQFDSAGSGGAGWSMVEPLVDYSKIVFTVCLETDQRIRVVQTSDDIVGIDHPRELVINVPDAHAWYIAPGTVTGVSGATLLTESVGSLARDNGARLRAIAACAKAWYGQIRATAEWTWNGLENNDLTVGQYVSATFCNDGRLGAVGTVLSSIKWDWRNCRMHYTTGYYELDVAKVVDVPGMSDLRSVARTIGRMRADLDKVRERTGQFPVRWGQGGAPAANTLFAVRVWQDGGTSDGDATTQCDRTYTVRTLSATGIATGGALLGAALTPEKARPTTGTLVVPSATGGGTLGLGYFRDKQFRLWDANETLDTDACP